MGEHHPATAYADTNSFTDPERFAASIVAIRIWVRQPVALRLHHGHRNGEPECDVCVSASFTEFICAVSSRKRKRLTESQRCALDAREQFAGEEAQVVGCTPGLDTAKAAATRVPQRRPAGRHFV